MSILIKNIKELVQVRNEPVNLIKGTDMSVLPTIKDAFLLIDEDKISSFRSMQDAPDRADEIIDASGKYVFPCWCDSHTHLVYAGSRESEFVDRIKGLSYEDIAKNGGGILNSAKKLNGTSEEELFESAMTRIHEIIGYGTGAVEIKSGYGLTTEGELKILRVIKKLKDTGPITIKSTFLGAHAIPLEYKDNRQAYIDKITNEMLPKIVEEGLADYCDVFCDGGFFTPDESDGILQAAEKLGLKHKIHANELGNTGGVQMGIKNNALSIDHLESIGEEEIKAFQTNEHTMPTIMPTVAFFLNIDYAPARKMIDAGLPVALASDYNPGSTPSGNMPFVLSLACLKLKMTPEEAINAATINSAYAMETISNMGTISEGKKASVFITKEMSSFAFMPYAFGSDLIETVIISGKIQ